MFTQVKRLAGLQGIAAGQIAVAEIPATGTIYSVYLVPRAAAGGGLTRAQMITDMGNVVLKVNGQAIIDADITSILDRQLFYGMPFANGNLPLYFFRPGMATDAERSLFALGTQDVDSISIEVNILGVAVLVTCDLYVEVSTELRRLGQHIRFIRYPSTFAAVAQQEITTLPKDDPQLAYLAHHITLGATPGVIGWVTVKVGGNDIHDQVTPAVNGDLLRREGFAQQAAYYSVCYNRSRDLLTGMLPTAGVRDFRLRVNWTTAPAAFNIYSEEIHGLNVTA